MAFRRRTFRRRRARVDMQTYRECGRDLEVAMVQGQFFTCANPLIFADTVLVVGDQSGMVLEKAGANRTVSFAGGHGQISYAMQICPGDTQLPLTIAFRIYTALMVLPLAENSGIAPAVLPNIAQSRSQLSVVYDTQSDSERRILWYRFDKLHWTNPQGTIDGPCEGSPCMSDNALYDFRLGGITVAATALYGRTWPSFEQFRVKARCRLTEREGLFLVTNIVHTDACGGGVLAIFRDAYLRYAVK